MGLVGILALQGDFAAHGRVLDALGVAWQLVKTPEALAQVAGLILLVAMIGAIVLTHRRRDGVRKQKISDQLARRAEETVKLRKVPTGKGI